MKELTFDEISQVSGGKFKIKLSVNLGTFVAGCCVGFLTAGPVGLGYALCGAVIAQGVNGLNEMDW